MRSITYNECYDKAKKYETLKDFREQASGYYIKSLRKNWLKNFTWLETKQKPKSYWNYKTCYEEAKKYNYVSQFHQYSRNAYDISRENGWFKDYEWLINKKDIKAKIDCVYIYHFYKTNSIYVGRTIEIEKRDWRHRNDVSDIIYKHSYQNNIPIPEPIIIIDKITIKEGLYYEDKFRVLFKELGFNILNTAKTGIESGSIGSLNAGKWNYASCYEEAKKYTYKKEFKLACSAGYNKARKNGWLKDYVWFVPYREDNKYWTYQTCSECAKQYESLETFSKSAPSAYKLAKKNQWLEDYTWLKRGTGETIYTYEVCYDIAKKYTYLKDFREKDCYAYKCARKNEWYKDYTWLKPTKKESKWTYESCYDEAKKYKKRREFCLYSSTAYHKAKKEGWIDDFEWL